MNRYSIQLVAVPCLLAGLGVVALALPRSIAIPEASAVQAPPSSLTLYGVVRDFREWNEPGGHVDFDSDGRSATWLACDYDVYSGNIANALGPDGRPVFTGGGFAVETQWTTSGGRPIAYNLYDAALGDVAGATTCSGSGGIDSAASFDQWYRDVPGVNASSTIAIRFELQADGTYLFDDTLDPAYSGAGGFFPIDDRLFGNDPVKLGADHNYHFTVQLEAEFIFESGVGQTFEFTGDDDVWVFINGRKVIDLGGVHSSAEQIVELDRLGLVDGSTYTLSFFFAERNRTASNFRVRTNLTLSSRMPLVLTDVFD